MATQATDSFAQLATELSTQISPDFTVDTFINNFHFIRPLWLLAFAGLFLLLYLLKKIRYYQSPWQHFLPPHLASVLLENSKMNANTPATKHASAPTNVWLKPFIIGSCIIIALAGPAWQKLPQPVYQLERGAVLIMDMSYSMYATDVKPNRLTRAHYKAVDLLDKVSEGDVGLIAYAGDAFIISPLTQDVNNIALLLPSLSPDIMPVHGANALAALTLANQTLKNAGHISGDIYWFTDDIEHDELADIYQWANNNNHKINILGIGSKAGAPIRLPSGELLKDRKGAIVIPKLPQSRLAAISQRGRGVYHTMTNDDTDIKALTAHLNNMLDEDINNTTSAQKKDSKQLLTGDQYQEQGPWLLLLILPLVLSYFRRGSSILAITWLMPLTFMVSFIGVSPNSYADTVTNNNLAVAPTQAQASPTNDEAAPSVISKVWSDLWKTADQQGQQHYQQQEYSQAATQFNDTQWQGSAHYKAGDFEQALSAFKESDSAQALYNQGNALAQLQKVDEAIDAYKQALAKDADLTDAQENLAALEAMKNQQEQSQQEEQQGEPQDKQDNGEDGENPEQQNQDSQPSEDGEQQQSEQQDEPQDSDSSAEQQQSEQEQAEQAAKDAAQQEQEQEQQSAEEAEELNKSDQEKSIAQQELDKKAQETLQKHQQLLNKVTDDPYLLLRNKMRLEYQKRRQNGVLPGETKKW